MPKGVGTGWAMIHPSLIVGWLLAHPSFDVDDRSKQSSHVMHVAYTVGHKQELSYCKQIARKLRTQYVDGNPVTLKTD